MSKAQDFQGNLYEVNDDHSQARLLGSEDDWKDLATLRMEVGPLNLLPEENKTDG